MRRVVKGDIAQDHSMQGIEKFSVGEKISAARESKSVAVQDIINRMSTVKSWQHYLKHYVQFWMAHLRMMRLRWAKPSPICWISKVQKSAPMLMMNSLAIGETAATLIKTCSHGVVTKNKNIIFKLSYYSCRLGSKKLASVLLLYLKDAMPQVRAAPFGALWSTWTLAVPA